MENGKALAKQVLSNFSFQVDEIDVGNSRTADLRVSDELSVYYIEVKDKVEGEEQAQERQTRLANDGIYEQMDPLKYNNRIRGILRDARKQLNETPKSTGAFQLIWFHADGIDADLKYRQAFATFYGYVHLIPMYPNNHLPTKECFYFDYNAAFDMQDIEALILTDSKQLQFCLNEFSRRADEFRSTKLFQEFHSRDGIYDPRVLEADGMALACRFDMPRNDENATARALQKQTGVLYSPIRLNRHTASVAVGGSSRGSVKQ